jgi:2-oxo-4-hydroxy-4-carboxy--5-ureidoimidazoline (OHCU) decarboxylase
MENKCAITGDIRQAIKKVQQDAQVEKIDKSGYAAMKDMNDKLSWKFNTSFLQTVGTTSTI